MAPNSNSFHGQMLLGVEWSQLLYFCCFEGTLPKLRFPLCRQGLRGLDFPQNQRGEG